ncbi:MAG: hypothetical protein P5702_26350, partial [Limnospira sp. PMC 1291.21]|nr:hypothetical protein [Limnospira sp. PMC 1238.20]MDT9196387.1 hypothetical protein [Limnospira sp. PMC 1245.20]MDT9206583.1 hypothetical protein [Limnospira sp. PMC 1243.20]MDT9211704.1 hypothetical protein [Limnospira sp. PMC 1252.20]MDT9216858.1 hypothetical protein [Limnospira sp. PMC 1256.20]MDT9221939.1 hypothetical protein [Limnospira sp. PMC 1240.20]MDT9226984.1 hypothetical protein [Limnospira sp. PMC 1279.21]MDT9232055.1 hypothetical protein [Limnospira sp. PMC 1242.20]MDT924228
TVLNGRGWRRLHSRPLIKTEGIDATLEVLKGVAKLPVPLNVALERLTALGVDIDSPEAKLFLRVIYQID